MTAAPSPGIGFSDLVICTDPSLQSAFGLGGRVGIVAEHRKRDARVIFLGPDRSLWLPFRGLRAATGVEAGRSPLATVRLLARELHGSTLEVSGRGERALLLVTRHGALTPGRIDEIRERLGEGLVAWTIRPGSMSRLESVLEIDPGKVPPDR